MKLKYHYLIYVFVSLLLFSSCEDDYDFSDGVIGEGEANVSATVTFYPLTSALDNESRKPTAGNAIKSINTLSVIVYNSKNELVKVINGLEKTATITQDGNEKMPSDITQVETATDTIGRQAEAKTAKAAFDLNLPYGKYYLYAVANMGTISDEMAETPAKIKDLILEWKPDDIAANNQMFGYFTLGGEENEASAGFNAHPIVVNRNDMAIHAWIKRAASKVTIAFDPSGLHNDVWIYVHKVTIKDIPKYCKLGADNSPHNADSLIADGADIIYDSNGIIEGDTDPNPTILDFSKWLKLAKGSGIKGSDHSETAPALYFFENMQGDYPDQKRYDKRMDPDKIGTVKPGQDEWKDNVPYGTYIEVEAYYVSSNIKDVTNGKIIYRFMLGKNITYNYNAQRNHHYKLTLGFRGFANQPDWHIVYEEEDPSINTPWPYYVPYMYNQKTIYPIRLVGTPEEMQVEIIENNWAPFDPNQSDSVPPATVNAINNWSTFRWNKTVYENRSNGIIGDGTFKYGLHKETITRVPGKTTDQITRTPPFVGFLALQVVGNNINEIPTNLFNNEKPGDNYFFSHPDDMTALENYYNGKGNGNTLNQGLRKFTKADLEPGTHGSGNNAYTVIKNDDDSRTIMLPLWTRQASMIQISGFTGNNPYETYQRKATLRIRTKFQKATGSSVWKIVDKDIKQVRRLVNPKAVWRRHDNTEAFNVKLMRHTSPSQSDFDAFRSDGTWKAYVEVDPGDMVKLSPNGQSYARGDTIFGDTDTPIDFIINFNKGITLGTTRCAIVTVLYHSFTCIHKIFVRQGYRTPVAIVDNGAKWSSFSLRSCNAATPFGWQGDPNDPDSYVEAVLTAAPLTLGTLFKKGNYADGIRVKNNFPAEIGGDNLLPLTPIGDSPLRLTNFTIENGKKVNCPDETFKIWSAIYGLWYNMGSGDAVKFTKKKNNENKSGYAYFESLPDEVEGMTIKDWHWAEFKAEVDLGDHIETRYYRVPTLDDYVALKKEDWGLGVAYMDGATETQRLVSEAYGFRDFDNKTTESKQGMRGALIYNAKNANQIFFPIGFSGIGRRSMQPISNGTATSPGMLKYGAYPANGCLTQDKSVNNQYRPIPYNNGDAPGAIYWTNKPEDGGYAWDINFFDINFNPYDYACNFGPYGDALPIKLVIDDTHAPVNPTSRKKK